MAEGFNLRAKGPEVGCVGEDHQRNEDGYTEMNGRACEGGQIAPTPVFIISPLMTTHTPGLGP